MGTFLTRWREAMRRTDTTRTQAESLAAPSTALTEDTHRTTGAESGTTDLLADDTDADEWPA